MAEKVPIYDNHIHMSPSGRNVDALLEFQKAGGTGLTLVTLPHPEVPIACGGDFMESYGITLDLAARARERTDLEINIAVGPYPVLIVQLAAAYGLEAAVSMMMKGMKTMKPIWKAVLSSEVTKAGMTTRIGRSSAFSTGGSLASPAKSSRSGWRTCASMKVLTGTEARSSAWSNWIWPSDIGR